jgi:hypothetical protein
MRVGYHFGTLGRMDIEGFDVETRVESGGSEFDRWYGERFGVVPSLAVRVADLDAAVLELVARGTEVGAVHQRDEDEGGGRWAVAVGPAGQPVEVVEPAPPEEGERRISGFIEGAEPLAGPPTEELLAAVLAVVGDAWSRIDVLLEGVAHNKVLATMLLAGEHARDPDVRPDAPAYWQRSAASTLLSGFVGRRASS